MILAPALQGQLPPEMDEILEKLGVSLYRSPNDVEEFSDGKVAFIGLNVYCREYVTDWHGGELAVSANNKGGSSKKVEGKCIAPLFESARDSNVPRNKWGREILPSCMYSTIMDVHERYNAPRIFITENGHGAYEQPEDVYKRQVINKPLIYVRGNHDDRYARHAPGGCICVEDSVYTYRGIRIAGLGGSMRYRDGANMYTEREMSKRMRKLSRKVRMVGGCDILLTHAPVSYTHLDVYKRQST